MPTTAELLEPEPQNVNFKDVPLISTSLADSPELAADADSSEAGARSVDFKGVVERLCHGQCLLLSLVRHADEKLEQLLLLQSDELQSKRRSLQSSSRPTHNELIQLDPPTPTPRSLNDECVPLEPVVQDPKCSRSPARRPTMESEIDAQSGAGGSATVVGCLDSSSCHLSEWHPLATSPEARCGVDVDDLPGLNSKSRSVDWKAPAPPSMEPLPKVSESGPEERPMSPTSASSEHETGDLWSRLTKSVHDETQRTGSSNGWQSAKGSCRASYQETCEILKIASLENLHIHQAREQNSILTRIALHHRFDIAISFVVALNALLLGLQVHDQAVNPGRDNHIFEIFEYVFTGVFTCELMLRVMGLRHMICWKAHRVWTVIDAALVMSGLLDVLVEVTVARNDSTGKHDNTDLARQSSSIGKVITVMRMARFLRVLRLVRFFTRVRIMVTMIIGSLAALFWLFALLTIVMYLFGVILTHGATDWRLSSGDGNDHVHTEVVRSFGSVSKTMYTLFTCVTSGLDWGKAAAIVKVFGDFYYAVFLFFIFFILFSVLNIVTGFFVDAAIRQADGDRSLRMQQDEIAKRALLDDLRDLLLRLDKDGDGLISEREWFSSIEDPPVKSLFSRLDIPLRDANGLFEVFDVDGDGNVSIAELVEGVENMACIAQSLHVLHIKNMTERTQTSVKVIERAFKFLMNRYPYLTEVRESDGRTREIS
eukprot:TRINITY_DN4305_c0_g1_i1.p1 TRINITY_DN4305_c0_g1~~TRINITY_DN4305_c0_g1_i1.p1  ORF type:complete len:712 (+),score=106.35 TRINITY_DN4305_c0_g1_i1:70-2205(+)